jgi:surface antigen
MSRRVSALAVAALGGLIFAEAALASANLRWLNYSPVRYFTDQDWALARSAAKNALDSAKDGETVEWNNPDSGAHGSLTPVSSTQRNGKTCRDLEIRNHANRLDGGGTFEFCEQGDGSWAATHGVPQ